MRTPATASMIATEAYLRCSLQSEISLSRTPTYAAPRKKPSARPIVASVSLGAIANRNARPRNPTLKGVSSTHGCSFEKLDIKTLGEKLDSTGGDLSKWLSIMRSQVQLSLSSVPSHQPASGFSHTGGRREGGGAPATTQAAGHARVCCSGGGAEARARGEGRADWLHSSANPRPYALAAPNRRGAFVRDIGHLNPAFLPNGCRLGGCPAAQGRVCSQTGRQS